MGGAQADASEVGGCDSGHSTTVSRLDHIGGSEGPPGVPSLLAPGLHLPPPVLSGLHIYYVGEGSRIMIALPLCWITSGRLVSRSA